MRLTPLDIREQQFRRVMRGLDPEEVETFLATVAGEFETLVAGNNELRQHVVELEEKITEYRAMEKALRDALLAAERVMGEAKESAQREAGLIVREAEMSAQRARSRLSQELVDLQRELGEIRRLKDAYITRVRWLLRSHLELVDGHAQEFTEIDASLAPLVTAPPAPPEAAVPPAPARGDWSQPPPPPPPPARQARVEPAPSPRPQWADPAPSPAREWAEPAPPPAREWAEPAPAPQRDWAAPRGEPGAAGPAPQIETWRVPSNTTPYTTPARDDLDDVMRRVGPDGTYDRASTAAPGAPRPASAEEIAQAARRAERLAAEARAALERHAVRPPGSSPSVDDGWNLDRLEEERGERP